MSVTGQDKVHGQEQAIDVHGARVARLVTGVLVVALIFTVLRVVIDVGQPLFSDDIWWHVALGRVMLAHGALPGVEPLLFTSAGQPQFYQEWLFEVVAGVLDAWGGTPTLRVAQVLLVGAILQQVYARARRHHLDRALALVVVAGLLMFAYQRFVQLRPHLCSMLFFYGALNIYCVPRLSWWRSVLLLAVVVVWTNMHATILLLFPFLTVYLLDGGGRLALRSRAHAWTLLGALLAASINPQGARVLWFYFIHDSNNALVRVVDEWGRIFVIPKGSENILPWSSSLLLVSFALVALSVIALALRVVRDGSGGAARRVTTCELLWAAMAVMAAALAVRFLWLMPLALIALLRGTGTAQLSHARQRGVLLAAVAVLMWHLYGGGVNGYGYPLDADTLRVWSTRNAVQGKYLPRAMLALYASDYAGHLYAPYSISGFASYMLYPRVRLFLNGRYDSYPRAVFEDYWRVFAGGRTLLEIVRRYGIDGFLLPAADNNRRLVHTLQLMGWCMAYQDDTGLWLRAPRANGTCAADGATLDGPIAAAIDAGDYQNALSQALRYQRYVLAARIVAEPAAAKVVAPLRAGLNGLCREHGALAAELGEAVPLPPSADGLAMDALCAHLAAAAALGARSAPARGEGPTP